ncbi:MAG: flagellar export chaperone FliS [Spirochaetota bacterium]|jgi:flagellar protein FliS|nr:flagellar export chaperone FliS [Spirochaetota bacterium]
MADVHSQYRETQIMTASQGKLVVLLYEGTIRFIDNALAALKEKKLDAVNNNLLRAQDIVTELALSINFDAGDLASKMYNLYMYFNRRLVEANIRKDKEPILEVRGMLVSLLDAWKQVADKTPAGKPAGASGGFNVSG